MRISDWSSDVCSSDLRDQVVIHFARMRRHVAPAQARMGGTETVVEVAQQPAERPGAAVAASVSRNAANGANLSSRPGVALMIAPPLPWQRSEEHPSELQSLMRISYAVFCLKKKN